MERLHCLAHGFQFQRDIRHFDIKSRDLGDRARIDLQLQHPFTAMMLQVLARVGVVIAVGLQCGCGLLAGIFRKHAGLGVADILAACVLACRELGANGAGELLVDAADRHFQRVGVGDGCDGECQQRQCGEEAFERVCRLRRHCFFPSASRADG
jgi:hypothetical protein